MKNWQSLKLKEVCQLDKSILHDVSLPYIGLEHIESNTGNLALEAVPLKVKSSTFKFSSSHLLYGRLRPYLNKVYLPDFDGHCSSEIFPIKCSQTLERSFLFYWFIQKNIVEKINRTSTGARMPRANVDEILDFDFLLPTSKEQKRIVAILDEAFAGINQAIANTEKNLANADEILKSYIEKHFSNFKDRLDNFINFGDVIEVLTDYHANGSYETLKKNVELKDHEDYAWMVRSTDFEKNFNNEKRYITESAYHFLEKSKVFGGEILISKIGNAGKLYLMPEIDKPCSLAMNLFMVRTNREKYSNSYLVAFFKSQLGVEQIQNSLQGATTQTITKKSVRDLKIPIISLEKQNKFVASLDKLLTQIDSLRETQLQKLQSLTELKQSLLQKAFGGELTANNVDKLVNL